MEEERENGERGREWEEERKEEGRAVKIGKAIPGGNKAKRREKDEPGRERGGREKGREKGRERERERREKSRSKRERGRGGG